MWVVCRYLAKKEKMILFQKGRRETAKEVNPEKKNYERSNRICGRTSITHIGKAHEKSRKILFLWSQMYAMIWIGLMWEPFHRSPFRLNLQTSISRNQFPHSFLTKMKIETQSTCLHCKFLQINYLLCTWRRILSDYLCGLACRHSGWLQKFLQWILEFQRRGVGRWSHRILIRHCIRRHRIRTQYRSWLNSNSLSQRSHFKNYPS